MTFTAAFIFIGIPLIGSIAGLAVAVGTLIKWNRTSPPESHYIASRHPLTAENAADQPWLDELDALKIPYRHTVC